MSGDQIPEQVYLDAARALARMVSGTDGGTERIQADDRFRALVADVYRAGQAAVPENPPVPVADYQLALDAMSDALLRIRSLAIDADALALGWDLDPQEILDVLPDFAIPDGPRTWALPPPDVIARRFHEAYERLAPNFGYRTREASAKPWDEVPPDNRALMIHTAMEVRNWLTGAAPEGLRIRALERDVIGKAKEWRGWFKLVEAIAGAEVSRPTRALLGAVDALTDATPADAQDEASRDG